MGVYINMKMPQSCDKCIYSAWSNFYQIYVCDAVRDNEPVLFDGKQTKSTAVVRSARADNCPLVPVPPHGRLIDADALLERFEKEEKAADEHGRDFSFSFKSGGENCTEWWPVQQMLMDAPTVLEAEEGET